MRAEGAGGLCTGCERAPALSGGASGVCVWSGRGGGGFDLCGSSGARAGGAVGVGTAGAQWRPDSKPEASGASRPGRRAPNPSRRIRVAEFGRLDRGHAAQTAPW